MGALTVVGFIIALHILAASFWFGALLFQVFVIGPAMKDAGPAGAGFMLSLARRGGVGKFFAISGAVTILAGAYLYGQEEIFKDPFGTGRNIMLSVGAIFAIVGYTLGISRNFPTEKKWLKLCSQVKGSPTPEQGAQLAALGARMGMLGMEAGVLIGLGMLAMALNRAF